MNVEKLAEAYLSQKAHLEALTSQVEQLKEMLAMEIDRSGDVDEKGHKWLVAGDYILQRQKRQGKKFINAQKAEEWARARGVWDEVKIVREVLNEDALLGFVYEHRNDDDGPFVDCEAQLESLYETPAPTWATMPPIKQKNYDY